MMTTAAMVVLAVGGFGMAGVMGAMMTIARREPAMRRGPRDQ